MIVQFPEQNPCRRPFKILRGSQAWRLTPIPNYRGGKDQENHDSRPTPDRKVSKTPSQPIKAFISVTKKA
jgi:hypothetical protein